jgi:hypothetical protein
LTLAHAGAIGISAPNPKLSVPVKGPPPEPCACTTDQGKTYTPPAFLEHDSTYVGNCKCADHRFADRSTGALSDVAAAEVSSWVHDSAYASAGAAGGPVAHVLPKVRLGTLA